LTSLDLERDLETNPSPARLRHMPAAVRGERPLRADRRGDGRRVARARDALREETMAMDRKEFLGRSLQVAAGVGLGCPCLGRRRSRRRHRRRVPATTPTRRASRSGPTSARSGSGASCACWTSGWTRRPAPGLNGGEREAVRDRRPTGRPTRRRGSLSTSWWRSSPPTSGAANAGPRGRRRLLQLQGQPRRPARSPTGTVCARAGRARPARLSHRPTAVLGRGTWLSCSRALDRPADQG